MFCQLFNEHYSEITNADITQLTKLSVHVNTSGWGHRHQIVLTLFHSTVEAFNVKSTA